MLTAGSSVSEVIVIFLQVILFASTAAFFVLCSDSSRLFLRRRTPVRKLARDGIASMRSITHAMFGLFSKGWPTDCFFMHTTLSYIVYFKPIAPS